MNDTTRGVIGMIGGYVGFGFSMIALMNELGWISLVLGILSIIFFGVTFSTLIDKGNK